MLSTFLILMTVNVLFIFSWCLVFRIIELLKFFQFNIVHSFIVEQSFIPLRNIVTTTSFEMNQKLVSLRSADYQLQSAEPPTPICVQSQFLCNLLVYTTATF